METKKNDDKLVTVAIHTFEKAQILKTILESEGIETYIHNVNLIQPSVSAGVRVRIKETDLLKALSIIEKMDLGEPSKKNGKSTILVPVDFSDYSMKACDTAFHLADNLDAEIIILHAYYTPTYDSMPVFDTIPYTMKEDDSMLRLLKKVNADMENLNTQLNRKIDKGELPDVHFTTKLREGIPEEEIGKLGNEVHPIAIVMGTRGKDRKEIDLIGSVTAEILERSSAPVIAIPEQCTLSDFSTVKNIVYATNFDPNDLLAFEQMMTLLKPFSFKVYLAHIEVNENAWNEIKLAGIKEYFKKQYPKVETEYLLIKEKDILAGLDKVIAENKIDLVSLNTHRRNIFSRLFNPSISRKMIFHAKTPMLILHS